MFRVWRGRLPHPLLPHPPPRGNSPSLPGTRRGSADQGGAGARHRHPVSIDGGRGGGDGRHDVLACVILQRHHHVGDLLPVQVVHHGAAVVLVRSGVGE